MTGLHDLQKLARTTKERLAQKQPEDAPSDLLAASGSSFGAVVLPVPGREVAPPAAASSRMKTADPMAVQPTSGFGAGIVTRKPSRLPAVLGTLVVVGGLAAAAAWYVVPRYFAHHGEQVAMAPAPAAAPEAASAEAAPAPAATAATPPAAPGTPTEPMAGAFAPPAEPDKVASPSEDRDQGDKKAKKEKRERAEKPKAKDAEKSGDAQTTTVAAGPATPAPAAAKPEGKTSGAKGDAASLDDLLNAAAPGAGGGAAPPPAEKPAENKPETLSSGQVRDGMIKVQPRVQACYEKLKVPGVVDLQLTISSDGKVKADVVGKFAGTETGSCVAEAVSHASFPSFSGPSMHMKYPFRLQ
jgi:hypothetical protein